MLDEPGILADVVTRGAPQLPCILWIAEVGVLLRDGVADFVQSQFSRPAALDSGLSKHLNRIRGLGTRLLVKKVIQSHALLGGSGSSRIATDGSVRSS